MAPYDVLVDPHTLPDLPDKDADKETTSDDTKDTDEVKNRNNESRKRGKNIMQRIKRN